MSTWLREQLEELGLTRDAPPSAAEWRDFLAAVERGCDVAEEDRCTLERAVVISTREMHDVNARFRENELRFRRLFDSGIIGIIVAEASGGIVEANDAFLRTLGYTREDFDTGAIGWESLTPVDWRYLHADVNEQLKARGWARPWEKEYLRKDGSRVPVLVGVARLEGERNISFSFELTALKKAEARKAAVVDRAFDAIVGMSSLGEITEWNPAAEEIFGYSRGEALGRSLSETIIPEALRPAHRKGLANYLASGTASVIGQRIEITALARDGREIPVELAVARVGADEPPSFIGFIRDLSMQKRADHARAALEEQLRQAHKMEAIGRLAGGIAHDFNNLLSVILCHSDVLLEELSPTEPIHGEIKAIHSAGVRARDMTRQLLAFSRQQVLKPVVIDLEETVIAIQRMLRPIISETIDLTVKTSGAPAWVRVDPSQIEQVVMNLVLNARDAMPSGGSLTIEISRETSHEDPLRTQADGAAGHGVVLIVSDTGTGMDKETQARIFEPFFTTKELGKGTGLGLSTVFGIVQQSRGRIAMTSERGHGTTFKVYLPAASATPTKPSEAPTIRRANRGAGETILLVEDDHEVRTIVATILRRKGYVVVEATNGTDALVTCERCEHEIHLLLTDVVMPGISGPELARRVKALSPRTKVLFMSGYADDGIFHHGVLDDGIAYLEKPITPTTLLETVRSALGR